MLGAQEITRRFLEMKFQVHPDVIKYIQEQGQISLIDEILRDVPTDLIVVLPEHLPSARAINQIPDKSSGSIPLPEIQILYGQRGSSGCISGDYLSYFRDRYNHLGGMIRSRFAAISIENLLRSTRYKQEEITIIGMVRDIKTTTNGHRIAEIEDQSTHISVLFRKDRPVFSDAERLIPDEVIGVKGVLSSDKRVFFADQLVRPDIRIDNHPHKSDLPGEAVFISDIHVGSDTFLQEAWNRFSEWLSHSEARYLLIAGDLVDGIGIYPGQERELTLKNIYDQYHLLGKMLSELPSQIKIILAPGNHDVVRGAEPQPAIPEIFTRTFPKNALFVENPALVDLQGVRILLYHGRSIDDMIGLIPGASYTQSALMMQEMLQRRHLAPAYGRRTPIAIGKSDRLIIDPLPDILHTGHVHITGILEYRGVLGINAGTWQSQTAFQKQMNVNPTPAQAVVVDLHTLIPTTYSFL